MSISLHPGFQAAFVSRTTLPFQPERQLCFSHLIGEHCIRAQNMPGSVIKVAGLTTRSSFPPEQGVIWSLSARTLLKRREKGVDCCGVMNMLLEEIHPMLH